MKKVVILFFLFVFCTSQMFSQNLKVIVNSSTSNEPLCYAYVYINGHIYSSADSIGVVNIPIELLKLGDTLSASFVGTKTSFVIYNKDVEQKKECSISLEQVLSLDGIVVLANDQSKEYFKKYVNIRYVPSWFDEINGDFSIDLWDRDNQRKINGIVIATSNPKDTYSGKKSIMISTESDTIGIYNSLRQCLAVLKISRDGVNFSKSVLFNRDIIIKYSGENDGKRIFFITRPFIANQSKNGESMQTLLFVDKDTKDITTANTCLIMRNGDVIYDIITDYAVDKKSKYIYPKNLNVTLKIQKEDNKLTDIIKITNISLLIHKRKNN